MPTFVVGPHVIVARDRELAMRKALALCATRHAVTSDTTWSTLELEHDSWPVRQLSRRTALIVRAHLRGELRWEPSLRTSGTQIYGGIVACGTRLFRHYLVDVNGSTWACFSWEAAMRSLYARAGIVVPEPPRHGAI